MDFRGSNREFCVRQTERLKYSKELQVVFHIELTVGFLSNLVLLLIFRASA